MAPAPAPGSATPAGPQAPPAPAAVPAAEKQEKPPEAVAFDMGREIMDVLRQSHTHISSIIEVISTELGEYLWPA